MENLRGGRECSFLVRKKGTFMYFFCQRDRKSTKKTAAYYIKPYQYISAHACFRWRIAPSGSRYPAEDMVCTTRISLKPRADNDKVLALLSRVQLRLCVRTLCGRFPTVDFACKIEKLKRGALKF